MTPQTILFIGPQGSGKGTQVRNITAHLQEADPNTPITHIETGAIFRALSESDSQTAKQVQQLLAQGQPVPDVITNAFVAQEFIQHFAPDAYLTLDGFPRNKEQAVYLDELLSFYERPQMTVMYLDVPEETVKERLRARGRADDTEENIEERLRWSAQMMEGLIAYYTQRPNTNFVTIDGSKNVTEVFQSIVSAL